MASPQKPRVNGQDPRNRRGEFQHWRPRGTPPAYRRRAHLVQPGRCEPMVPEPRPDGIHARARYPAHVLFATRGHEARREVSGD